MHTCIHTYVHTYIHTYMRCTCVEFGFLKISDLCRGDSGNLQCGINYSPTPNFSHILGKVQTGIPLVMYRVDSPRRLTRGNYKSTSYTDRESQSSCSPPLGV